MIEQPWKDCPACGVKNSMKHKKGLTEHFALSGHPPLDIQDLDGEFCSCCGEGFWSPASEKSIAHQLGMHRTMHDT